MAKLTEMPHPVSDRIMTMRIPLTKVRNSTIVSAYAPTMFRQAPADRRLQSKGRTMHSLNQSSEDNKTPCWTSFQQVVYDTAKAYLDKHGTKHQDWFDPNNQILRDLMAKMDQSHQTVLQIRSTRSAVEAYKDACRILQRYTRARKHEWWEMKAEELQRAADRNDMKGFYSGLKKV